MSGVEVRKIETEVGETGVGVENRIDTTYELGAEIDGAWVPFARVTEATVEHYQQRAKDAAEREKSAKGGNSKAKTAASE